MFNLSKEKLRTGLVGFGMGAADLVPGVSGGTIAFVSGIYAELVKSVKYVTNDLPLLVVKGELVKAWNGIPFGFLLPLGIGILTAVFGLSTFIKFQLENNPVMVWSLFFGLIVASIVVMSKQIERFDQKTWLTLGGFAVASFWLMGITPTVTPFTPLLIFVSGAIAICAMILPGISGSFLLVLLGKYEQIITAVSNRDVGSLVIFGLGIVTGLALFSRFLGWLLANHSQVTMIALTGLLVGSLRKVWPWKTEMDLNYWPGMGTEMVLAIVLAILGAGLILWIESKSGMGKKI